MTSVRLTREFDIEKAAKENRLLQRQLARYDTLYTHSLIDRVGNGIIPVPRSHVRPDYRIRLSNDDPEAEWILASALPHGMGGHPDIERSIYAFFRDCARIILQFGQAFYEVVYEPPIVQLGRLLPFRIVSVIPGTVECSFKRWVQKLPKSVARESKLPCILALDQERILRFGPPVALDGKIDQIMDSLTVLSKLASVQFMQHNLRDPSNRIPFDFSVFSATQSQALAAAARSIGWLPTNFLLGDGKATEHYWWHRELRFERFLAELRSAILTELNAGLESVGRRLGTEMAIVIEGLPSVGDIDSIQRHLLSGDWSLESIHEAIKHY
jgi:hypothetical protein